MPGACHPIVYQTITYHAVARFKAFESSPITCLRFNGNGTLLAVADVQGREVRIFSFRMYFRGDSIFILSLVTIKFIFCTNLMVYFMQFLPAYNLQATDAPIFPHVCLPLSTRLNHAPRLVSRQYKSRTRDDIDYIAADHVYTLRRGATTANIMDLTFR